LDSDLELGHHEREKPTLNSSRELFMRSLTATIRSLQTSGKKVIVLQDVPEFAVTSYG